MIFGSNDVYEPVAAYDVGQYTRNGIISGGNGGNATATQGVNFKWVYDPNNPSGSGFSGGGSWHQTTIGSPIWYYQTYGSGAGTDVVSEIADGTRTNLNDVFAEWQSYVNDEGDLGHDVVQEFQQAVGYGCWSNLKT